MSYVAAKDISRWQGGWRDTGEQIVMIKMSGGDDGLYMDDQASVNYSEAVAAGKAVGGYHFIGWAAGAEQEASYFLRAMSPLSEGDVYALDVEAIPAGFNPVQYVQDMANYIHDHTGVWPLIYMSLDVLNSFDWSTLLGSCGLWLADWAVSPDANIPTHYTYVMQQYNDGPSYDHDAWFGTVEEFKAYGYHAPQVAPAPPEQIPVPDTPTPLPVPLPEPTPTSEPTPEPVPAPAPTPPFVPDPITPPAEPTPTLTKQSLIERLLVILRTLLNFFRISRR